MDPSLIIQIISLVVLLVLSSMFSCLETTYSTVNKIKLKGMIDDVITKKELKRLETTLHLADNYSDMLTSILIGNNIVNIAASAITTTIAIKVFGSNYVGIITGILTVFILIFSEITPKRHASAEAEKIALKFSGLLLIFMKLCKPFIFIMEKIAEVIGKVFHINLTTISENITEEELKTYIDVSHAEGAIEKDEMEMIYNVFEFKDAKAQDIMIPKIDMETIHMNASYDECKELFMDTMYSRIPVYKDKDNPDEMLGTINFKDFFSLKSDEKNFSVKDILRGGYYTLETKKVRDLLNEMQENRSSVTFVLNEYGATVGMITMEDLLEELVGEIRDEYDKDEEKQIKKIKENQYLIDASMNLSDVNDELGTKFDSEDYNSLGGLLLEKINRIPRDNDKVTLEDGTVLVAKGVKKHRISKIEITFSINKEELE